MPPPGAKQSASDLAGQGYLERLWTLADGAATRFAFPAPGSAGIHAPLRLYPCLVAMETTPLTPET